MMQIPTADPAFASGLDAVGRPPTALDATAFSRRRLEGVAERMVAFLGGRRRRLRRFADATLDAATVPAARVDRRDVPARRVVGSVGRAADFTPSFRPVRREDEERWSRVRGAILSQRGVPPVELLEFEGNYFVVDGHHRVSAWRDLGATTVEAFVRRVVAVPTAP